MSEEFVEDIIIGSNNAPVEENNSASAENSEQETTSENSSQDANTDQSNDELSLKDIATQLGWREDYTGEDAVDAATYILRSKDIQKSMGKHNKDLKDQLNLLNGSVEALKQHNEKVYQSEVKRLQAEIAGLKKERKAAIELADVEKVEALDSQIEDLQKDIATPKTDDKSSVTSNQVYEEWVKDNQWYITDPEMAQYADAVAQNYVGAPLERIYSLVRSKVQEVFPEKFEVSKPNQNTNSSEPKPIGPTSPVERPANKGASTGFTKADLTPDQIAIMNQFVRGGIMTEEQYINDIAKMQG